MSTESHLVEAIDIISKALQNHGERIAKLEYEAALQQLAADDPQLIPQTLHKAVSDRKILAKRVAELEAEIRPDDVAPMSLRDELEAHEECIHPTSLRGSPSIYPVMPTWAASEVAERHIRPDDVVIIDGKWWRVVVDDWVLYDGRLPVAHLAPVEDTDE